VDYGDNDVVFKPNLEDLDTALGVLIMSCSDDADLEDAVRSVYKHLIYKYPEFRERLTGTLLRNGWL